MLHPMSLVQLQYSELGACSPVGGRHFYIPGANSEPPHSDQTIKAGGPRPPGAMAGSVRVKHYVFGMLRHCLFFKLLDQNTKRVK